MQCLTTYRELCSIYLSQRHNLPATLAITTHNFPKFSIISENFKISKKNPKFSILSTSNSGNCDCHCDCYGCFTYLITIKYTSSFTAVGVANLTANKISGLTS